MKCKLLIGLWLIAFLMCGSTLAYCGESSEQQPIYEYFSNADIFTTGDIILKIKDEYIQEVTDDQLLNGCLNKIYPQHPSYDEFLLKNTKFKQFSASKAGRILLLSHTITSFINSQVSSKQDAAKLLLECRQSMVKALDDHSKFYSKEEYLDIKSLPKNLGTIGIEFITEEVPEKNTIISVFKSSPADKAGMIAGDVLLSIDGVSVNSMSVDQIVKRLRGEVDSKIEIEIQRHSSQQSTKFKLLRKKVTSQYLESKLLFPNYGYIRIRSLQSNASNLFAKNLHNLYLENKGDLHGLVLDLRNNKGGLLDESSGIVAPFLPPNSFVVELKGRSLEANIKLTTHPSDFIRRNMEDFTKEYLPAFKKLPLVILIDKQTASGAEIIAETIKEHKRGSIVGQLSFGMNSVQTIFPMHSGEALKITTARWHTSAEISKNKPIIPDISTETVSLINIGTEKDTTLNRALEFLVNNQEQEK